MQRSSGWILCFITCLVLGSLAIPSGALRAAAATSISPTLASVVEGSPLDVTAVADPEGSTFTSLDVAVGDCTPDNADLFAVTPAGRISNIAPLDFETTPEAKLCLQTDDRAGGISVFAFPIEIRDLNEPPTAVTPTTAAIDEGAPAGTVMVQVSATDP